MISFNFLNSEFPFSRGLKKEVLFSLGSCSFMTLLLFLLRPYGLEKTKPIFILGIGIAVFVSTLINQLANVLVLKRLIKEDQWNVWKEILRSLLFLCVNVMAIIRTLEFYGYIVLNLDLVLKFIGGTLIFAVIPITIRTLKIKNWILKKTLLESKEPSQDSVANLSNDSSPSVFTLTSNIVNDAITIELDHLLFIEADKNYITIVEEKQDKIHKTLLRLSLIKAKEQIDNSAVVRCHRSYLVNLNAVLKVNGNSQGLKLVVSEKLPPVPVSRSYKNRVLINSKDR